MLEQIWAWERMPIGRPRVVYIPKEGVTVQDVRKAKKAARRKDYVGTEPPAFGSQFQPRVDCLAVR